MRRKISWKWTRSWRRPRMDRFIRTQAAVALGRVEAVDALPQIEALLKSLTDTPAEKTLDIEVRKVIEHLRAIKEKKK
jgi:hypothetical protein